MKALLVLSALLLSASAQAAEIRCSDEAGELIVRATVPADINLSAVRNFEIKEALVHIGITNVRRFSDDQGAVDDHAHGGLEWDEQEGQLAVRTRGQNFLVSLRTGPFVNGVAVGRFENGAGPQTPAATCVFIN